MNNIIYFNIIRTMDKKIQKQKEETIDIVKNGYSCIGKHCVIYPQCRNRSKTCDWDLRSNFYKTKDL